MYGHSHNTSLDDVAIWGVLALILLDWPRVGGAEVFLAAGVFLIASVGGKLAGVHLAGKILNWQKGEASIIGWLLQTKALIMIIFANILLDKGVITSETFTAMLLMAIVSTMLTIPMVKPKLDKLAALKMKG